MGAEWDAARCSLGVWVGINIRLAARGANIVKEAYGFGGCDKESCIYALLEKKSVLQMNTTKTGDTEIIC